MRKTICLITTILAFFIIMPFSFAASQRGVIPNKFNPDIYIGGLVGYANLHYKKNWLTKLPGFTSVDKVVQDNWSARLFLGYAFNKFFSIEAGYVLLQGVHFEKINGTTDDDLNQTIIDATLRLTLPLGEYFGIYGKGGGAYVHRNELKVGAARYRANNKYVPVFGGGLKFNFNTSISAYAEYDYYMKSSDLPYATFLGIGLGYQFG